MEEKQPWPKKPLNRKRGGETPWLSPPLTPQSSTDANASHQRSLCGSQTARKLENAVPSDKEQSRAKAQAIRQMISTFLFVKLVLR